MMDLTGVAALVSAQAALLNAMYHESVTEDQRKQAAADALEMSNMAVLLVREIVLVPVRKNINWKGMAALAATGDEHAVRMLTAMGLHMGFKEEVAQGKWSDIVEVLIQSIAYDDALDGEGDDDDAADWEEEDDDEFLDDEDDEEEDEVIFKPGVTCSYKGETAKVISTDGGNRCLIMIMRTKQRRVVHNKHLS